MARATQKPPRQTDTDPNRTPVLRNSDRTDQVRNSNG